MLSVRIKDFQSIGNIPLDIEKFTVVVGKNNLGKSAIIRAVDAALFNRTGNEFIRRGKTKTEVQIKKDGLDIEWKKGDKASYTVNKESFTALNRGVPKPIQDAGFKKLEIGDLKLNVLIAHQFNELFIIDEPGPVVTDIISTIYDLNVINDADTLCQKKTRSSKSLLKTRESDYVELIAKLDKYKEFEAIKKDLEVLKSVTQKCSSLKNEILDLIDSIQKVSNQNRVLKNYAPLKTIIIPGITPIKDKLENQIWLTEACLKFEVYLKSVQRIKPATVLNIPKYDNTELIIQELNTANKFTESLIKSTRSYSKYKAIISHLVIVGDLSNKINVLEQKTEDINYILKTNENLTTYVSSIKSLKESILLNNTELTSDEVEYQKFKVCPLCSNTLGEKLCQK